MRDQAPFSPNVFPVLVGSQELPEGAQPEEQHDHAKRVLIIRDACVHYRPAKRTKFRSEAGVILDEQDGKGNQDESWPRKESLDRAYWVRVAENNEDDDEIAQGLEQTLDRHFGVVGPDDAHSAVEKEEEDRSIGL